MSGVKPERRAFDASLRANGKRSISGHASVFDVEYDVGPFREVIRAGTFAESIKTDDVRALWGHDANIVLGRNKAGTLLLKEDSVGLAFVIDAPSWAEPHLETIRRGDVTQASFAFTVDGSDGERFQRGTNGEKDLRVITRARLWDVSPVTYPASSSTDVSVRALQTYETWSSRQPSKPRHRVTPSTPRPSGFVLRSEVMRHAVRDDPEQSRQSAHHEAGHAVAAVIEGVGVRRVELRWRLDFGRFKSAGGTCHLGGPKRASAASYLAGKQAVLRCRRWASDVSGCERDDDQAKQAARRDGSSVTQETERARQLLDRHWGAVCAVANALLRKGCLGGAEVERLVQRYSRAA